MWRPVFGVTELRCSLKNFSRLGDKSPCFLAFHSRIKCALAMADDDFVWLDGSGGSGLHSVDNTFFISASNCREEDGKRGGAVRRSVQPKLAVSDESLLQASSSFIKEQQDKADRLGMNNSSCKHCSEGGEPATSARVADIAYESHSESAHVSPAKHTDSTTDKLAKKSWLFILMYTLMMVGLHAAAYVLIAVDSKCIFMNVTIVPRASAHSYCAVADLRQQLFFMYLTLFLCILGYLWLVSRSRGLMPNCEDNAEHSSSEKSRRLHIWAIQLLLHGPGTADCVTCGVIKPQRSKHSTGSCIPAFDHYCVWTGGPVSATNHRAFVVFVMVQLLHLLTIVPCLVEVYMRKEWGAMLALKSIFTAKGYVTAACTFVDVFFIIFTTALLLEQLKNAAQGVTTNERLNAARFPYVQEILARKLTVKDGVRRLVRWFTEGQYAGVDCQLLADIVAALPSGQRLGEVLDTPVATGLSDRASELWDHADVRVSLKRLGVRSAGQWYGVVRQAVQEAI